MFELLTCGCNRCRGRAEKISDKVFVGQTLALTVPEPEPESEEATSC